MATAPRRRREAREPSQAGGQEARARANGGGPASKHNARAGESGRTAGKQKRRHRNPLESSRKVTGPRKTTHYKVRDEDAWRVRYASARLPSFLRLTWLALRARTALTPPPSSSSSSVVVAAVAFYMRLVGAPDLRLVYFSRGRRLHGDGAPARGAGDFAAAANGRKQTGFFTRSRRAEVRVCV